MFRAFKGSIIRMLFVVCFGFVSFWPTLGVIPQCIEHFSSDPLPVSAVLSVWAIPLLAILPVPMHLFVGVSSCLVASLYGIGTMVAMQAGLISSAHWMAVTVIGLVFVVLGWIIVAVPIWRNIRGVVAVQSSETDQ